MMYSCSDLERALNVIREICKDNMDCLECPLYIKINASQFFFSTSSICLLETNTFDWDVEQIIKMAKEREKLVEE